MLRVDKATSRLENIFLKLTHGKEALMRNVLLIARRELAAYLRTMSGYVIIAVMLFIDGLLFNAYAVPGARQTKSPRCWPTSSP